MLEQEGLFFLHPVYDLLFEKDYDFLELSRSSVHVCYKEYHNTYKGIQTGLYDLSLEDAVDQKLTPGNTYFRQITILVQVAAVEINGGMHAMVLDTVQVITDANKSPGYKVGHSRNTPVIRSILPCNGEYVWTCSP